MQRATFDIFYNARFLQPEGHPDSSDFASLNCNQWTMATTSFYTLFESASGYGIFSILETEEIGAFLEEVRRFYLETHILTVSEFTDALLLLLMMIMIRFNLALRILPDSSAWSK